MAGFWEIIRPIVRDLVVNSGAVPIFHDYTPTPDPRFPIVVNQAYTATKWTANHRQEIGVDRTRLAVAGNMAAVVALMAKDKKGSKLIQQVLLLPVTDTDFSRPSYTKFAQERFLTTPLMKWMWDNYLPNKLDRKNKYASPLQASLVELQGLPPALVQVVENDILHAEGVAYARKLDQAGVLTTITEYKGFIHDYGLLNPIVQRYRFLLNRQQ